MFFVYFFFQDQIKEMQNHWEDSQIYQCHCLTVNYAKEILFQFSGPFTQGFFFFPGFHFSYKQVASVSSQLRHACTGEEQITRQEPVHWFQYVMMWFRNRTRVTVPSGKIKNRTLVGLACKLNLINQMRNAEPVFWWSSLHIVRKDLRFRSLISSVSIHTGRR